MKIIDIKNASVDARRLVAMEVADDLRQGKLVVFPTETVYGLACDMNNSQSVERVFEIKGRDKSKPLPVMIGRRDDISSVARNIPSLFFELADKYMPGPLTVVLEKQDCVSDLVSGGLDTVGVRMPKQDFALNMINYFSGPIVATSANLSGEASPYNFEMAYEKLKDRADVFVDDGVPKGGVPSTIVNLYGKVKILRQGDLDLSSYVHNL